MTTASLVLEFLKVLVWPAVVGGVLIGYRSTARRLLARLIKIDAAGVSATFDKSTEQATKIADSKIHTSAANEIGSIEKSVRVRPNSFQDARTIGENYRGGESVLLDLSTMNDIDARRLVDFSAGLVFQSRGSMDRVTNRVFLITPGSKLPMVRSTKDQ